MSRRLRSVSSNRPGSGLPSSIQVVPPSARLPWKVALPPIVWFHGSQSSMTGGGSSALRVRAIWPMARLAHIISWVLITALGMPVLPEVNRNLAIVLGSMRAIDCATASVGRVATSSLHGNDCIWGGGLSTWTSNTPERSSAASARA